MGKKKAVVICTVHAAKGLEWDAVFVCRQNQGSHPLNFWPSGEDIRRHNLVVPPNFDALPILERYEEMLEARDGFEQVSITQLCRLVA